MLTTNLQHLFSEVLTLNKQILEEIAPFEHSLLTLMRASLEEQRDSLERLIPIIKDEEKVKDPFIRNDISIVFLNHEVSNPLLRSWGRANAWMDLPSISTFEKLAPLLPMMKQYLEDAALVLGKIYGTEEIKYVVSSYYIPTIG